MIDNAEYDFSQMSWADLLDITSFYTDFPRYRHKDGDTAEATFAEQSRRVKCQELEPK